MDRINYISCVILTYNEQDKIRRCINSIKDVVDEIVVYDTGSTDDTLKIIEGLQLDNLKIFYTNRFTSFSKARNEAINLAKGNIIFILDADEWIDDKNSLKFKEELLAVIDNYTDKNIVISPNIIETNIHVVDDDIPRIFRKSKDLKYYGYVHEELRYKNKNLVNIKINLSIHHDGYKINTIKTKNKIMRNTMLLIRQLQEEPTNLRWLYYLYRDAELILSYQTVKLLWNIYVKKDYQEILTVEYGYSVFIWYLKSLLNQGAVKEVYDILNELESKYSLSVDLIYMKKIANIMNMEQEYHLMLREIITTKNKYNNYKKSIFDKNGYHMDSLIMLLLFECGDIKHAKQYYDCLKEVAPQFINYEKLAILKEVNGS